MPFVHAHLVNRINQTLKDQLQDKVPINSVYVPLDKIVGEINFELGLDFKLHLATHHMLIDDYEGSGIDKTFVFYHGYMLPITNLDEVAFTTKLYYHDMLLIQLSVDNEAILGGIIKRTFRRDYMKFKEENPIAQYVVIDVEDILKSGSHITYLYSR